MQLTGGSFDKHPPTADKITSHLFLFALAFHLHGCCQRCLQKKSDWFRMCHATLWCNMFWCVVISDWMLLVCYHFWLDAAVVLSFLIGCCCCVVISDWMLLLCCHFWLDAAIVLSFLIGCCCCVWCEQSSLRSFEGLNAWSKCLQNLRVLFGVPLL